MMRQAVGRLGRSACAGPPGELRTPDHLSSKRSAVRSLHCRTSPSWTRQCSGPKNSPRTSHQPSSAAGRPDARSSSRPCGRDWAVSGSHRSARQPSGGALRDGRRSAIRSPRSCRAACLTVTARGHCRRRRTRSKPLISGHTSQWREQGCRIYSVLWTVMKLKVLQALVGTALRGVPCWAGPAHGIRSRQECAACHLAPA
jgi:hypothetical protein